MPATTPSADAGKVSEATRMESGVHFKPFTHAYNPIPNSSSSLIVKSKYFSFLEATEPQTHQDGGFKYDDSIAIHPHTIGVPWPTSFPACRGSKHWRAAEVAAEQYLYEIHSHHTNHRLVLPKDLQGKDMESRLKKETELVETAVTSATYMFADASKNRVVLIAKILLLVFLHDDVVEFNLGKETLASNLIDIWPSCIKNYQHEHSTADFSSALAYDVLDEDFVLGAALLESVRAWLLHTREYTNARKVEYKTLREYLDFRSIDIGQGLLLSGIKFACNVHLSPEEMMPFAELMGLYSVHISLTNDMYSFDKELKAHEIEGALLINAVAILHGFLSVGNIHTAKTMVHQLILGIEDRMDQVYLELRGAETPLNARQWRLVRGIFENVSGHIFYSATIRRYGGKAQTTDSV